MVTIEGVNFRMAEQAQNYFNHLLQIRYLAEIDELQKEYRLDEEDAVDCKNILISKLVNRREYTLLAIRIPDKQDLLDGYEDMVVIVYQDSILALVESKFKKKHMLRALDRELDDDVGKERLLYEILDYIVDDDIYELDEFEDEINELEVKMIHGDIDSFNVEMLDYRKKLLKRHAYYQQLHYIAYKLMENENGITDPEYSRKFQIFAEKITQLSNMTQIIKEYTMQVRDVYENEIDIRQNNIMRILTVVTTIFTPLMFIAGWYGMNFKIMPELSHPMGYLYVIILSLISSFFTLWICKKKGFF